MTFQEYQKKEYGYDCITTFWDDFCIAEKFGGISGVKDTFRRAFKEWKDNYKYLTELVIVLNRRCWMLHNRGMNELSSVYLNLYEKAHDYALNNLEGEEFDYYHQLTD